MTHIFIYILRWLIKIYKKHNNRIYTVCARVCLTQQLCFFLLFLFLSFLRFSHIHNFYLYVNGLAIHWFLVFFLVSFIHQSTTFSFLYNIYYAKSVLTCLLRANTNIFMAPSINLTEIYLIYCTLNKYFLYFRVKVAKNAFFL